MRALLIVDLQNDFCHGGALPAPDGDKIIPVINNILDKFELVIASKDWHLPNNEIHFKKWPVHCVQNTHGAEFPHKFNKEAIHKIFLKGTGEKDDGYSAFEATNANLEKYLQDNNIKDLYVAGLTTEYCVKNTVFDARKKGINTYVINDAISGVKDRGDSEKDALKEMRNVGAKIINIRQISHFTVEK